MSRRIISLAVAVLLLFQQTGLAQSIITLNLSSHIGNFSASQSYRPLNLRYFSYDPLTDNFQILLDKGGIKNLKEAQVKQEGQALLKYFLVGVTLPNENFWVNLRPDAENQVISSQLEKTDVGKVLLEADLQLKKDTAHFTSPQTAEGRAYWDKLYQKAAELFGSENITIPALVRPWIVPGEVIIRETQGSAYVYKGILKVMLEEDHLKGQRSKVKGQGENYVFKDERFKEINEYSAQLIRETIIPKLTEEINSSEKYAPLRQVFYSLILSRWFKARFAGKSGTYANLIDSGNLNDLTSKTPWSKTPYFNQYKNSFSQGEYNIKERANSTLGGPVIKTYFSGGFDATNLTMSSSSVGSFNGNPGVDAAFMNNGMVFGGRVNGKLIPELSESQAVIDNSDELLEKASSALVAAAHEAIVNLIHFRDNQYLEAVRSRDTAYLAPAATVDNFTPGRDVYLALRESGQALVAQNIVSYAQIEGHIKAAMEQNAILLLEAARSQLGYALNEKKIVEYVNMAIEKLNPQIPIILHGDHIQYTEDSFKVEKILKEEYEDVNGKGSFKEGTDIEAIDMSILKSVQARLIENAEKERIKETEIIERLIKARFTSIAIDASTIYDLIAGIIVMDYYKKQGTEAEKLVVKLDKDFALPLEWGTRALKADLTTRVGLSFYNEIVNEIEDNMTKRNRPQDEIKSMLKDFNSTFGILVREARNANLDPQEVISAYDKIMKEEAEATIAGKIKEDILSTVSEKQKLLLLSTSNARETAYQLKQIERLLKEHRPELIGHFGIEVEVGHVDRKVPNPRRGGKLEAKMTHPMAVRVMGLYLQAEKLLFDLVAANNGSGHATDYEKATLTAISQVGKISPYLTLELQEEAEAFLAAMAQHGTSGSDMDELTGLSEAGVIKFNVATNYQQIVLNVMLLLAEGYRGEALLSMVEENMDALVNGLDPQVRKYMSELAVSFKENPDTAEIKEGDSLFDKFMKLTYAWGMKKGKISPASDAQSTALLLAKEFKRVFGAMDEDLMGLAQASSAIESSARVAYDSRGRETVEVELTVGDLKTTGDVAAGASTGGDEARTVSVEQAIKNIDEVIIPMLNDSGLDLTTFQGLVGMEKLLIENAGPNFATLGANATIPVSRALWYMAAKLEGLELYQYIRKYVPEAVYDTEEPVRSYMNIYNGGLHALKEGEVLGEDRIDIQEIMIVPLVATYAEALAMGDKIDHALKEILSERFNPETITRADEAGFSVKGLGDSSKAIDFVVEAIWRAGYAPGEDVKLAFDTAATSFLLQNGKYHFRGKDLTSSEMIEYYVGLAEIYPDIIKSYEDGLGEDDWEGWQSLTEEMKKLGIDTVGDDLFVTQLPRLNKGIGLKAATDVLIKENQNGTVGGALQVVREAKQAGMGAVISHRSGETTGTFIADLAVGINAKGLKTGDPQPPYDFGPGGEYQDRPLVRRVKYLRMIEIEETEWANASSSLQAATDEDASLRSASIPNKKMGGIDFRAINMVTRPMGNLSGLSFVMPRMSSSSLKNINLDTELNQIQNMLEAEITPSEDRLKEFVVACYQRGELREHLNEIVMCLVDTFDLQAARGVATPDGLKELVLIIDAVAG